MGLTSPFVAASGGSSGSAHAAAAAPGSARIAGVSARALLVYDSLSVVSGLWAGLWLRLWLLLAVQAPLAGCRIWLTAVKTGCGMSANASAASAQTAFRLVWHLAHLSLAVLGTASCAAASEGAGATDGAGSEAAGGSGSVWRAGQQGGGTAAAAASTAASRSPSAAASIFWWWWARVAQPFCGWLQHKGAAVASALPGGTAAVQLLHCVSAANSAVSAAAVSMGLWLSGLRDSVQSEALNGAVPRLSLFALLQAAALRVAGLWFRVAEHLTVLAFEWLLRDVPPLGRAAVWGSAGMIKGLVVEASRQSGMLAAQLLEAWRAHPH